MRKLIIIAAICIPAALEAQNALTSDLVEGGKTLLELIKIIRVPRMVAAVGPLPEINNADSCKIKNLADVSFRNKTGKTVQVSLFLRTGNTYAPGPLFLTVSSLNQESLYELKAGIYKYKVESGEEHEKYTLHEGEFKLEPCDKLVREIK